MMQNLNPQNEPVAFASLVTAALVATVAVIALVTDISSDVISAVNIAIAAWVLVIARAVRSRVSPVGKSDS